MGIFINANQRIKFVEEQLSRRITPKKGAQLFRELDKIPASPFTQERVVSLYGRVMERVAEGEIEEISKTSEKLQKQIEKLRTTYAASGANFEKLAEAERVLEEAFNAKSGISPFHSSQKVHASCATAPEEMEELFEVAYLLHKEKNKEARAKFFDLPTATRDEVGSLSIERLFAVAFKGSRPPSPAEMQSWFNDLDALD